MSKIWSRHQLVLLGILCIAAVLRIVGLTWTPPSPYWEEVALGYDAYSLLRTGMDHHGNPWPIVAFESFGDYKPVGYFYALLPSLAVFGLNVFAVRLPSALAGVGIVWYVGKLAEWFFIDKKKNANLHERQIVQYIAMMVTAISPWAIQFSRAAWEVNLATFFLTAAMYHLLTSVSHFVLSKKEKISMRCWCSYCFGVLCALAAVYTYHATRVIAPILGVSTVIPLLLQFSRQWRVVIIGAAIGAVGMFPFFLSIGSPAVSQRFAQTSIFSDIRVIERSNAETAADGGTVFARLIHHRYVLFAQVALSNALSHTNLGFLFLHGDANPRHSTQLMGVLYYTESALLLLGLLALGASWQRKYWYVVLWVVVVLIPVSLTNATPHALRILPFMPVVMLVITRGIVALLAWGKDMNIHTVITAGIIVTYSVQLVMFLCILQGAYRTTYAREWQFGYAQMIASVQRLRKDDEAVYMTREQGRPAMYYWFYTRTDPRAVQAAAKREAKDQSEFLSFESLHFVDGLSGNERGIIVSSPEKANIFPQREVLDTISDANGKPLWSIYRQE